MVEAAVPTRSGQDALPANVVPAIEDLVATRRASGELPLFPILASAANAGRHVSRTRGRGMDYEESRPYQPGDDVRAIDWRVTARITRTHTKVYREERERPVYVLADLRPPMFLGSQETKSVCAARMAAALAWATLARGDRIGGSVIGPESRRIIRSRRSRHAVLRLIQALHELAPRHPALSGAVPSLADMIQELARVSGTGATVFLISDFHDRDASSDRQLYQLARHHQVVLVYVYDRLEQQLPPPGNYPVGDGERVLELHTDLPRDRIRFEQAFQAHLQGLEQQALGLRSRLLRCPAGADTTALLHQHFARRTRTPLS